MASAPVPTEIISRDPKSHSSRQGSLAPTEVYREDDDTLREGLAGPVENATKESDDEEPAPMTFGNSGLIFYIQTIDTANRNLYATYNCPFCGKDHTHKTEFVPGGFTDPKSLVFKIGNPTFFWENLPCAEVKVKLSTQIWQMNQSRFNKGEAAAGFMTPDTNKRPAEDMLHAPLRQRGPSKVSDTTHQVRVGLGGSFDDIAAREGVSSKNVQQ